MKPDPKRDALLKELRQRLLALYGERLDRLVLFGSHARGDNHEGSDIDVMVVLKGPLESVFREIDRIVDVTYPLDLENGVMISVVPVSSEDFQHRETPLLLNVRREGRMIEVVY